MDSDIRHCTIQLWILDLHPLFRGKDQNCEVPSYAVDLLCIHKVYAAHKFMKYTAGKSVQKRPDYTPFSKAFYIKYNNCNAKPYAQDRKICVKKCLTMTFRGVRSIIIITDS